MKLMEVLVESVSVAVWGSCIGKWAQLCLVEKVPKSVLIDYIYIYPTCTHADGVKTLKTLVLLAHRKVNTASIIDVLAHYVLTFITL